LVLSFILCCGVSGLSIMGPTRKSFTSDFEGLSRWCEQSVSQNEAETASNAIRGRELSNKNLQYLKDQLLQKDVRWRLEVQSVGPTGVSVRAYLLRWEKLVDKSGRPYDI